ncbi:MAG TPA: sigma-70 family RNA polymerase sigma factor [Rhodothermales bacterium]|nr:sigma-70 family RNA polymerase sigma factor [Rhodothermales bacterium]
MHKHNTHPQADSAVPPGQDWQPHDFGQVSNEELAALASPNVLESAAYFELWRRTYPLVSDMVHQRLKGQDAEHAVTAFFCHKLPRVLPRFTPRSHLKRSFEAWLTTVTRNYLNDEWRRNKTRRTRQVSLDDEGSYLRTTIGTAPRIEKKAEREHLVYFLQEIMNQLLKEDDRYIFHAHYWQGKTFRVIAAELGMTEENVRVRHYRAKKRLYKVCATYREADIF